MRCYVSELSLQTYKALDQVSVSDRYPGHLCSLPLHCILRQVHYSLHQEQWCAAYIFPYMTSILPSLLFISSLHPLPSSLFPSSGAVVCCLYLSLYDLYPATFALSLFIASFAKFTIPFIRSSGVLSISFLTWSLSCHLWSLPLHFILRQVQYSLHQEQWCAVYLSLSLYDLYPAIFDLSLFIASFTIPCAGNFWIIFGLFWKSVYF